MSIEEKLGELKGRLEQHDEEDARRFSKLDDAVDSLTGRVNGIEKKVARGAFLGILLGEALSQGAVHLGDVLALLGG